LANNQERIDVASKPSLWGNLSKAAEKLPKRSEAEQAKSVALLEYRQSAGLDLWTGLPSSADDNAARIACSRGTQEKPPITEAALTIAGLKAAKQDKVGYKELCLALDEYLEGGKDERIKFEKLSSTQ